MKKEVKKYPVKYTLMPIMVTEEIKRGLKCSYVGAYIVSKTYIKEERIKHNEDSTTTVEYDVEYPYTISISKKTYGKENNNTQIEEKPLSMKAFKVFDSIEEARITREEINKNYMDSPDYLELEDKLLELTTNLLTREEKRIQEIEMLEVLLGNKPKEKVKRN